MPPDMKHIILVNMNVKVYSWPLAYLGDRCALFHHRLEAFRVQLVDVRISDEQSPVSALGKAIRLRTYTRWASKTVAFLRFLHCALAAAQCIVIGPVCVFRRTGGRAGGVCVCLWVCYHNSKLRASILTELGLENVWPCLTTASAQCLRLLWAFFLLHILCIICRLHSEIAEIERERDHPYEFANSPRICTKVFHCSNFKHDICTSEFMHSYFIFICTFVPLIDWVVLTT